jgi:glycosyltransferase involved in cell wall biosynthesis
MDKLISVIITAYNTEKYIAEAIESVLVQTYPHFELILVDDGSTDKTLAIMQEYQKRDKRIMIDSHENMGMGPSSNRAIKMAKGEYIARLDADDRMLPKRLEVQVDYLKKHPEVNMVSCLAEYMNEKGQNFGIIQKMPTYNNAEDANKSLEQGNLIGCPHAGFMATKEVFESVNGYRNLPCYIDVDLFTRMVEKGNHLVILPEVFLHYRLHNSSVTVKSGKKLLAQQTRDWLRACLQARLEGKPEMSFEEFVSSLKKQPFWAKFHQNRSNYFWHHYRNAILYFGNKNYLMFMKSYLLAGLYSPEKIIWIFFAQVYNRLLKTSNS